MLDFIKDKLDEGCSPVVLAIEGDSKHFHTARFRWHKYLNSQFLYSHVEYSVDTDEYMECVQLIHDHLAKHGGAALIILPETENPKWNSQN
jgi:hypothetical protein